MQLRVDDRSIGDDEALWRDVLPIQGWIARNPDGSLRASSMAFLDGYSRELSVHRASLTSSEKVLEGRPGVSIAEVLAHVPRLLGHIVVADPEPDDPSHTLICPPDNLAEKRRKKDARQMAAQARLLVVHAPESVLPPEITGAGGSQEKPGGCPPLNEFEARKAVMR